MGRLSFILVLFLLFCAPKNAQGEEEIGRIWENNEGNHQVFWSEVFQNIKTCPSLEFERWVYDICTRCDLDYLYVSPVEAELIYRWLDQFSGFENDPVLFEY